jgi:hypothetical protein
MSPQCKKPMDSQSKRCSILPDVASVGWAFAFGNAGLCRGKRYAYEALRVLGSEFGRDALHQIVSIRGTKGDPQPERWKIVVEDPQGGGVRELEIADGRIDSDNEADRDVAGSTEGATIDVSRLNLDSSGAYAVASHTAEASHTEFCNSRITHCAQTSAANRCGL